MAKKNSREKYEMYQEWIWRYGKTYRGKKVKDIPTSYFQWIVSSTAKNKTNEKVRSKFLRKYQIAQIPLTVYFDDLINPNE